MEPKGEHGDRHGRQDGPDPPRGRGAQQVGPAGGGGRPDADEGGDGEQHEEAQRPVGGVDGGEGEEEYDGADGQRAERVGGEWSQGGEAVGDYGSNAGDGGHEEGEVEGGVDEGDEAAEAGPQGLVGQGGEADLRRAVFFHDREAQLGDQDDGRNDVDP